VQVHCGYITGIDRDARSTELARAYPEAAGIDYLLGDFLLGDFLAASFEPDRSTWSPRSPRFTTWTPRRRFAECRNFCDPVASSPSSGSPGTACRTASAQLFPPCWAAGFIVSPPGSGMALQAGQPGHISRRLPGRRR